MHSASRFRMTGNSPNFLTLSHTILGLFSVMVLALSATGFAQGLGSTITLQQKQAPKVYLPRNQYSVVVTAGTGVAQDSLSLLKTAIESQLPKYNPALKVNDVSPDITLSCTLVHISSSSFWTTKYKSVYKKKGTHTEYDALTKTHKTVDDYGYVQESYQVTDVRGSASVRYEIKDAKDGKLLDADTLNAGYWQEHEFGAPGPASVRSFMLYNIARQLAGRFLPSFQAVEVPLPRGELKGVAELLKKRRWDGALELLRSADGFKKPETEAYRLYALGLACEALAYESPDWLSTRTYLEQAAKNYADAEQKNASERVFREASARLSATLASYKNIEGPIQAYEVERRQKAFANLIALISKNLPAGEVLVTNQAIVDLARNGTPEKEIREKIKKASAKVFDLSSAATDDLKKAGVTAATLDAMREAMRDRQDVNKPRSKWWALGIAYLAIFYPYLILL